MKLLMLLVERSMLPKIMHVTWLVNNADNLTNGSTPTQVTALRRTAAPRRQCWRGYV